MLRLADHDRHIHVHELKQRNMHKKRDIQNIKHKGMFVKRVMICLLFQLRHDTMATKHNIVTEKSSA